MKTLLLGILFIVCNTVEATPKIYMKSTPELFSKTYMVKGEKEVKFRILNSEEDLDKLFADNKLSAKYMEDYNKYSTRFHLGLWGGLGLALIYILSVDYEDFNPTLYWGIFGTGLFYGTYNGSMAQHSLYKAINTYNGVPEDLAFNNTTYKSKLIGPKLRYTWQF